MITRVTSVYLLLFYLATFTGLALAGPPTRDEVDRQARVLEELKKGIAAETTPAGKLALLTRLMKEDPNVEVRRKGIELVGELPMAEREEFLSSVLAGDPDAGVRSEAAKLLGKQGSEKSLAILAKAAATDPTTDMLIGCIGMKSSARRSATFAIADLTGRFPELKAKAATELRNLKPPADPTDRESLADARDQSLYRVTGEEALLKPYFEKLRSDDAKVRRDGVVAFRFFGLKTAPAEIVAAIKDEDQEVRSWAALVLGEIADVKTVPFLISVATDPKQDPGLRCSFLNSLGQMKAASAKEAVRKLLDDPNEAVAVQAAIAHYRLTGEKTAKFPEGYNAD